MLRDYIKKIIKILCIKYSKFTHRIIYPSIILCFILLNLGYFDSIIKFLDSDTLTFRFASVSFSIYRLIKSGILLIVLFFVARFLHSLVESNIKNLSKIKTSNKVILSKIFQIFIYFAFCIIALDLHGIDISTFAFLGGAVGVGVGLGLQKITSNFLSGLILLFEQSIKEGDLIEISNGVYGSVKYTSARYTLVETFNGQEVMIPNDEFITSRVTNWTHSNNRGRIDIKIKVSYNSDIEKARDIMISAAREHKNCSRSIEIKCHIVEFSDSGIELFLLFWVENIANNRIETKSDVMRMILSNFQANKIVIPFPQYDIHIK